MPRLDGIEALPQVRAVCPGSQVVIFSGDSDTTMESEARAAGAAAVIPKDTGATTLVEKLAVLFQSRRVDEFRLRAEPALRVSRARRRIRRRG